MVIENKNKYGDFMTNCINYLERLSLNCGPKSRRGEGEK